MKKETLEQQLSTQKRIIEKHRFYTNLVDKIIDEINTNLKTDLNNVVNLTLEKFNVKNKSQIEFKKDFTILLKKMLINNLFDKIELICNNDLNELAAFSMNSENPGLFDDGKNKVFKTLGYCVGEDLS